MGFVLLSKSFPRANLPSSNHPGDRACVPRAALDREPSNFRITRGASKPVSQPRPHLTPKAARNPTVARARTEPVSPLETSPQPDPLFGRRAEPAGRTGLCLSAWLLPQPQLADQPTRAPRVDSSARAYPCPRALDSVRSGAFQPNPSVCAQPLTILTRGLLPMRSPSAENRVVALTRRPQFRTRGLGFQRRAHRPVGERSIAPDRDRITRPGISCGTRANLTRMGSFLPDTSDLSRSDSLALRPRGSLRRMLTSVMDHIPSSLPVVLCSHTFELIPHRLPLLSAPLFTFT